MEFLEFWEKIWDFEGEIQEFWGGILGWKFRLEVWDFGEEFQEFWEEFWEFPEFGDGIWGGNFGNLGKEVGEFWECREIWKLEMESGKKNSRNSGNSGLEFMGTFRVGDGNPKIPRGIPG